MGGAFQPVRGREHPGVTSGLQQKEESNVQLGLSAAFLYNSGSQHLGPLGCLQTLFFPTTGRWVLLASSGQRPGMLLNKTPDASETWPQKS